MNMKYVKPKKLMAKGMSVKKMKKGGSLRKMSKGGALRKMSKGGSLRKMKAGGAAMTVATAKKFLASKGFKVTKK